MKKARLPILSLFLYIIGGLLGVYGVWSIIYTYDYISELIAAGQLQFSGSEFDIISFFMTSSAQYIVFALILAALAVIIHKLAQRPVISDSGVEVAETVSEPVEEDDLESDLD